MVAGQVRRAVLAAVMVLVAVGSARAQEPAGSIDQLRVLVKRGDTITVTDTAGHVVKGSIVELSSQAIRLRTGIHEQDVLESEIRTIRQRKDDSLKDGARTGFLVGAIIGFVGGAFASQEIGFAAYPIFMGIYGSIGAGMGVGLDAMVTHNQTIYDSAWQPRAASIRFGVRLR